MTHVLLVGLGGFIGAILRYWIAGLVQGTTDSGFPVGTLAVNVLGCLVAGAVWSVVEYRQLLNPEIRIFVTIGVLGAFTTFSAFGFETFVLIRDNQYPWAMANVVLNFVLCIGAVVAGWMIAKAFGGIS
jgi:CrcB protein